MLEEEEQFAQFAHRYGPSRLDPLSWTKCLIFVLCVSSIVLFTRR